MELVEIIYKDLEKQAQLCTSSADIEIATSLKIKIAKVVHILAGSVRTRGELGMLGRLLKLETNLTLFLTQELGRELKELIRSIDQEENPDR